MAHFAKTGRYFHPHMPSLQKGWVFILPLLFVGCAVYHPAPLTSEAVEARLQQPAIAELQILAGNINHPILQPVELNPEEGLAPDRAAVLAVLLNPSLRAARNKRGLAGAQLMEAGLLPNPVLAFSVEVPSGGDTTGKANAYGLGLNWDATSLLSRGARMSRARSDLEAVDLDLAWQEWQVAQAAKSAVYQLAVLERQIDLAQQRSTQADHNLVRIQAAVTSGFMTIGDLNAAQTASAQAGANLLDLEKRALLQQLKLKRLLGLPAQSPIRLDKNIPLPARSVIPESPSLLQGLEDRRLDLLALRHGYDSQEETVRVAIMEQFPKISLGPTFNRDTDKLQTIGVAVSIELPIFNQNQGRIAQARVTRQMLFDEYVNRVFETRSDIASILAGMSLANEQLAAAQALARETLKRVNSYRSALAEGRIDALTYAAAWEDHADTQMRILDLEGALAQAEVALQLASGLYEIPQPEPLPDAGTVKPTKGGSP